MNKLEKYINYIVDDLVKDTVIDYDEEEIIYPFRTPLYHPPTLFHNYISPPYSTYAKYVQERYGAKEEEIETIFNLYKERILYLIK